jgi:hypothetical protein
LWLDKVVRNVYTSCMVRTQLYLDDEVHQLLRRLAERQGRTISDLLREALVRAYGRSGVDHRLATLDTITSLWLDRDDLDPTGAYVRRLRRDTRPRRPPA